MIRWRRLPRAAVKTRQGGRIQPNLPNLPPPREDECAICHDRFPVVVENERGFCRTHLPELAAKAITSPGAGEPKAAIRGVFLQKAYPSRRMCERILRLAGRTVPAKKPPRPKKWPRDRRYVR